MNDLRPDDIFVQPKGPDEVWPGEQVEVLGLVRYRLRPNRYSLAVKILFSWLLINAGCAGLMFAVMKRKAPFPFEEEKLVDSVVFLVMITVGGLIMRHWAVNRWILVVNVCELGFEWRRWRRADHYLWDEMTLVEEFRPDLPTNDYRIHFLDGTRISLSRGGLDGHRILGQVARFEALARGIPVERNSQTEVR